MMKKRVLTHSIVFGVIFLLIGTSIVPRIAGNAVRLSNRMFPGEGSISLLAAEWWPMFHHDLNHTGYTTSPAPETSSLAWSSFAGGWLESSPAVVDDKVFIGSEDDNVYCFDARTGLFIWSFPTGQEVVGSPAISEGKVYIGSADYKVYCLDASTGAYNWVYATGGCILQSSPALANGKVYIGSHDYKLYCLDAETGAQIWEYTTDYTISSSPSIVNGKVYIGSMAGTLYCLDAETGTKLWDYAVGYAFWCSSPAVSNERVYIGAMDYQLYCFDALTGAKLWNYTTGSWITGTPAVADGNVYIGSWDNVVYCLNAMNGMLVWEYPTNDTVTASAAVADGKVYIGSSDHAMYCLNAFTGEKIWEYITGDQILSSPAIAKGRVYVGSHDYHVYCFGKENIPPVADFTWAPLSPHPNQPITFDASESYDPDGSIILYEWDWDNDGLFNDSSPSPTTTHQWPKPGNYPVMVRVTDENMGQACCAKTIEITNESPPPDTPILDGPSRGKVGISYNYTAVSNDPDNDAVYYWIEWDDGTTTGWLGPYPSGQTISITHTFTKKGSYEIRCQAKNTHNATSSWGTLKVIMPVSFGTQIQSLWNLLFKRFIQIFPNLRNFLRV